MVKQYEKKETTSVHYEIVQKLEWENKKAFLYISIEVTMKTL
jgi:hypothetical protein